MELQRTLVAKVGSSKGMDHLQVLYEEKKISKYSLEYMHRKHYKQALPF